MDTLTRRRFMQTTALAATAAAAGNAPRAHAAREFGISLAGWSLHRTIGEGDDKIPMLDMPKVSRQEFDIEAIELVNRMLPPHAESFADMKGYLDTLAKNAADNDVKILLIMVDGEGSIGHRSKGGRDEAVTRHKKWIDIAEYLGCHSIRMNWAGAPRDIMDQGDDAVNEFIDRSVPGLRTLAEYGDGKDINVIIENHGGPSSFIKPLVSLMESVDHPRFGTLPDFGNFYGEDPYEAVDAFMKYAKAVSAKCYDFDDETGMETKLDFPRLIEIVCDKHGYDGYIGIEYEGSRLSEFDGIKACKNLLEKLKA